MSPTAVVLTLSLAPTYPALEETHHLSDCLAALAA